MPWPLEYQVFAIISIALIWLVTRLIREWHRNKLNAEITMKAIDAIRAILIHMEEIDEKIIQHTMAKDDK